MWFASTGTPAASQSCRGRQGDDAHRCAPRPPRAQACSPPPKPVEDGRERPLVREGVGGGVEVGGALVASRSTPLPNPPPQGGRERAQSAAQAGFTLFEALVALALLMGFVAVLGPQLSHGRRIMAHAEGRVAAQVLLRALLDAPFDRAALAHAAREGGLGALRWRLVAEARA